MLKRLTPILVRSEEYCSLVKRDTRLYTVSQLNGMQCHEKRDGDKTFDIIFVSNDTPVPGDTVFCTDSRTVIKMSNSGDISAMLKIHVTSARDRSHVQQVSTESLADICLYYSAHIRLPALVEAELDIEVDYSPDLAADSRGVYMSDKFHENEQHAVYLRNAEKLLSILEIGQLLHRYDQYVESEEYQGAAQFIEKYL